MTKAIVETLHPGHDRAVDWAKQVAIVVGASLFVALCARITVPLPFTLVPLTLQNFAVLVVGLVLGPRRAFAALVLYLVEGAAGFPVFNPIGPGGIAQLLGPTGGYLMAYPFVAAIAGVLIERGKKAFTWAAVSALAAETVLFAIGVTWLAIWVGSAKQALNGGLYPFVPAEVIKILMAAAVAVRIRRSPKVEA